MKNALLAFLILLGLSPLFSQSNAPSLRWEQLDEGLQLAIYDAPQKSEIGDSKITILRIDPKQYDFQLWSGKMPGEDSRTADQWAAEKGLSAVINAGMYQTDYATNVGYMKIHDFVNQGLLNKDNAIVAFNPKAEDVPAFQIIDLKCQDWESLKDKYHDYSQSIRMVDCYQKNRWSQQNRKWSMVVIGKDKAGHALFIFTRSPYTVHDFINILLRAPLDLYNLMYLEGGPEASFYLKHGNTEIAQMGSYETGFNESDNNNVFWRIPNVIGIKKR